jgi:glycosyltransferase involved in cell wall biosynthesis
MRVLLDVSYLTRPRSGSVVYIEQLAPALRAQGVDVVEVCQPRRLRVNGRNPLRTVVNATLDAIWLHGGLPRAARAAGADVVHHPLPAHSRRVGVPQVVTIHDVAFLQMPGSYGPLWRRYAAAVYRRAARRAEALVCVSEATAREAEALLGADRARIVVARHGPGQVAEGAAGGRAEGSYLVCVGDVAPRKNLDGLLTAYAGYRAEAPDPRPLVLAGRAASAAGQPGVQARPAPTAPELIDLMRGALALVHPSLHEGFGLPLLEAMALGVPVVAVRNAGTEELCGDAALLVEPAGLAGAIGRVAEDAELRASLSRLGAERARSFSWSRSAADHVRAYSLAAGR